jgi:hypothetical protein
VRVSWDPHPAWQFTAIATRTDKGENDLGEPFVPGSPLPDVATLEGTPEHARALDGTVRWWPASGVDVAATLGWERVDDAGHVAGRHRDAARASLAFRLAR